MNSLGGQAGGVKIVYRGAITMTVGNLTGTATITAVVMDKSECRHLGQRSVETTINALCTVELTNTTTVTATRASSTGTVIVGWEVTEYY